MTDKRGQLEEFKQAACELETADDPERFKEQLAKRKSVETLDAKEEA